MKEAVLISLIICAILTIQTQKMKIAVIYLSAFSIMVAFVYLLQGAPDVALAEAIIGSTMTTILFVVALHKYKLFRIYMIVDNHQINDNIYKNRVYKEILEAINVFCYKKGLDPLAIYTVDAKSLVGKNHHHIVLETMDESFTLSYHMDDIKAEELYDYLLEQKNFSQIKRKIY